MAFQKQSGLGGVVRAQGLGASHGAKTAIQTKEISNSRPITERGFLKKRFRLRERRALWSELTSLV
jgi:hypothetical protein